MEKEERNLRTHQAFLSGANKAGASGDSIFSSDTCRDATWLFTLVDDCERLWFRAFVESTVARPGLLFSASSALSCLPKKR